MGAFGEDMHFGVQARALPVDECGLRSQVIRVPLGKCYGGFRYWRIPRRSPGVAYRKISPPMGAGGYFMEVPWALPVGLHII